jgi:hypothetical protein
MGCNTELNIIKTAGLAVTAQPGWTDMSFSCKTGEPAGMGVWDDQCAKGEGWATKRMWEEKTFRGPPGRTCDSSSRSTQLAQGAKPPFGPWIIVFGHLTGSQTG